MNERQVQSVILFFYLSLPQESLVTRASVRAISQIRRRWEKKKAPLSLLESLIVQITQEHWKRLKHRRFSPDFFHKSKIAPSPLVSHKINMRVWKQFCKQSPSENVLAVIWSRILGLSDKSISTGLKVSTGTVRYRVSHGLRELGLLVQRNNHHRAQ